MDSVSDKWRSLRGARVYVDANAWIYARQSDAKWDELRAFLALAQSGSWKLVTSEMSLAETLVWPIKSRDRQAQSAFQRQISSAPHLIVLPVTRAILLEAATLRATRSLEMPDAIHAATAKLARCSHFLTGDELLARAVHLPVLRLSESGAMELS
jgi:predicted nucleic acid-binding protein